MNTLRVPVTACLLATALALARGSEGDHTGPTTGEGAGGRGGPGAAGAGGSAGGSRDPGTGGAAGGGGAVGPGGGSATGGSGGGVGPGSGGATGGSGGAGTAGAGGAGGVGGAPAVPGSPGAGRPRPARLVVLGDSIAACSNIGNEDGPGCSLKKLFDYTKAQYAPTLVYDNEAVGAAVTEDVPATQLDRVAGGPGHVLVVVR